MKKITSFKDLLVWQKGLQISVEVYKITKMFPSDELFGLTGQARRAANSIALNIAEGYGRHTTKSYINYLVTSRATLNEVETSMLLAIELNFICNDHVENLMSMISEESKMLSALIASLSKPKSH